MVCLRDVVEYGMAKGTVCCCCLRLDALHLCGRLYGRGDDRQQGRADGRCMAENGKA